MKCSTVSLFATALLCFSILQGAVGHNILFFHGVATSSHRTAIWPLASALADLGHNITYIFAIDPLKRVGSHPKIEEIVPSKMVSLNRDFVADFDINIRLENRVDEWLQNVFSFGVTICEAFYDSPETQEWLSRPNLHYDLVLIDASFGECSYGLVHKFKAKHIVFTPFVCGLVYDTFGVVPESSSIPDPFFDFVPIQMTLMQRFWNTIAPLMWRYNGLKYIEQLEPVVKNKLNLTDMPPIVELEKNTSLVFYNGHFVEEYPMSLPPMYVSYSGIRCDPNRKNKPLPTQFANFINDTNAFIYVSLGSAVDVGKMPVSLRTSFFEAFKSFTGLKFFWRWSGPIPEDKPDNVMLAPWFPQLDMLDHPKIKAFITQGGRPSIQEALCSNVPIISIPIFADQDHNAMKLERIGALVRLDINTITENDIAKAIQQVLYNPKYSEKMGELSRMFKDRPVDPLKNLVYWTEYALRHDTSLLKPLAMEQTCTATASHKTAIWPLAAKLADLGHHVTYIFPMYKKVGSHPRIEEIIPSKMVPLLAKFLSEFDINIRLNNQTEQWVMTAFENSVDFCASFYESPEIQEWIVRPDLHFDLIFIDASLGECGYGLVHMFQAKHGVDHAVPVIWRYNQYEFGKTLHSVIEEKLNITNLPPLVEFERNSSLVFLNHHFVEEYPISLPPLFVPYSGLGCSKNTKVKPLPEKLANFIQDTDGFIYVSFGSAVIASGMPKSMRDTFFEAFEAFPNLKFFLEMDWNCSGKYTKECFAS
ncbi:UDP-glucuronosyltransferase 1-2 [Orchesella cincta]|uniref:UDP-glucuronosyltransferase 1-2 n=1 Tax=Orchesella cincta TaxID=48709 RepID=A0A1D2N611_ORCCI|nr:UDP-glucuronosyltransferase 1-2 [Orchesella cincta]